MTHIILFFSWMFSWPFLNKKVPFFIFTFFILLLFSALRFNFGNDYISYYYIYNGINEGRYVWGSSDFLFKQLALLMPNYYFLIGVTSVFFISTIYFLIKNTLRVKQYWLAVMLLLINPYVFLVNLSSLRQSIALCFFIYAVHFATQKKFIKYTFLIIIAAGFHQSAIVLLPVYFFISGRKINVKRMIVIFSVLGLLLFTPVWDRLLIFLLQYFPQYAHYVQTGGQNSLRATIISSFFFFLIIFNINKLEGKEIMFGKLALLSTIFSLLAYNLSLVTRVGMYFDMFMIVALPLIFSKINSKLTKQILFILMIIIYASRYMAFFSNPMWEPFGDYQSILTVPLGNP